MLWEVEHDTGAGGRLVHELYTDREALETVERRMRAEFGEPQEPQLLDGFVAGLDGLAPARGVMAEVVFDVGPGTGRRVFTCGNSVEHARRVGMSIAEWLDAQPADGRSPESAAAEASRLALMLQDMATFGTDGAFHGNHGIQHAARMPLDFFA